jgi:coproporphyrinogen III oxidase
MILRICQALQQMTAKVKFSSKEWQKAANY